MSKEKKVKLTVEVPRWLWKRAKLRAVGEERDLREIVIDALERYLARAGKKGGRHA